MHIFRAFLRSLMSLISLHAASHGTLQWLRAREHKHCPCLLCTGALTSMSFAKSSPMRFDISGTTMSQIVPTSNWQCAHVSCVNKLNKCKSCNHMYFVHDPFVEMSAICRAVLTYLSETAVSKWILSNISSKSTRRNSIDVSMFDSVLC